MICLEEILLVVVVHLRISTSPPCTARVDEGIRVRVTGLRVQGLPVAVGVEDRPPLNDLGRALCRRPTLVLRGHPG